MQSTASLIPPPIPSAVLYISPSFSSPSCMFPLLPVLHDVACISSCAAQNFAQNPDVSSCCSSPLLLSASQPQNKEFPLFSLHAVVPSSMLSLSHQNQIRVQIEYNLPYAETSYDLMRMTLQEPPASALTKQCESCLTHMQSRDFHSSGTNSS
jgi:hypothetical protein